MNNYIILSIGFFAQLLFGSRQLVQWLKSEKSGEVLSPVLFWQISLLASLAFMVYGLLRSDLVIIIGQLVVYFIYIRNLQLKSVWKTIHRVIRVTFLLMPFLLISYVAYSTAVYYNLPIFDNQIPLILLIFGFIGQFALNTRFIYQWYYSEKIKKSELPVGFWRISLAGAFLLLIYAVLRKDPVLLTGQLFGMIVFFRNIRIYNKNKKLFKAFGEE